MLIKSVKNATNQIETKFPSFLISAQCVIKSNKLTFQPRTPNTINLQLISTSSLKENLKEKINLLQVSEIIWEKIREVKVISRNLH